MPVVLRLAAALLYAVALLFATVTAASAHPQSTSAVLLDVESDAVRGDVQLPLDRLAVALHRKLTRESPLPPLVEYARAHIRAVGTDGIEWQVDLGAARIERVDAVDHLVMDLTLRPSAGEVTDFDLQYDVIVEELITHKVMVTADDEALAIIDWTDQTVRFDGDSRGVVAMAGLGVGHIAEGADHLLFLLMLLIPAPLIARGGRWRRRDDLRGSVIRVVHVVTAFALGHSITLALATFDLVALPTRLVESLIALSILVSALHALRPLVPRGEAIIAVGFGLVHGLAFAEILAGYGLSGGALVAALLGFNLGIELTQLLVVALMMPSLYLLSRTRAYSAVRTGVAVLGVLLSGGWLLERTTVLGSDPFASISQALVAHPFAVAAVFALAAAVAHVSLSQKPPTGAITP